MSNEISDLCEICDLLLFVSYFASQSKGKKFRDYFFDVCSVNQNFLIRCQIPTTSYSTGVIITIAKILDFVLYLIYFSNPNPTYLNTKLLALIINFLRAFDM